MFLFGHVTFGDAPMAFFRLGGAQVIPIKKNENKEVNFPVDGLDILGV